MRQGWDIMYGRIDLSKIDYELDKDIVTCKPSLEEATEVFVAYCKYKKFKSVYPLYQDDIDLYSWNCLYENGKLVAWEQTLLYPNDKIGMSMQFAWNYDVPSKSIGWRFSFHVPAWLKSIGYKYLYLGDHHDYKAKIKGYEVLAPIEEHINGNFKK